MLQLPPLGLPMLESPVGLTMPLEGAPAPGAEVRPVLISSQGRTEEIRSPGCLRRVWMLTRVAFFSAEFRLGTTRRTNPRQTDRATTLRSFLDIENLHDDFAPRSLVGSGDRKVSKNGTAD